jgi:hypothetical protein
VGCPADERVAADSRGSTLILGELTARASRLKKELSLVSFNQMAVNDDSTSGFHTARDLSISTVDDSNEVACSSRRWLDASISVKRKLMADSVS